MRRKSESIFARSSILPSQLRTVADRRLDDAQYLRDSDMNRHANGAMYLGGFVVECLLMAKLLEMHPWLASSRKLDLRWPERKRVLWRLCYRSHDLDEILASLPEVLQAMETIEQPRKAKFMQQLKDVCAWTVYARYSPRMATIREAEEFLIKVREVRPWLK